MNRSCKRRTLRSLVLALAFATSAHAATGFRPELLGSTIGFATSLAVASDGTIYYSTAPGDIVRFDGGANTVVAHVPTEWAGDAGLLGLALADDHTAIVHYSTPRQTAENIARVDLTNGSQTVLHSFVSDITFPGRSVSAEHHGGNPIVTESGAIYFGIGDFAGRVIAAEPDWYAGKIFRIDPDGNVTQVARGLRNPFDLAWDPDRRRLVLCDNGDTADDEIDIIENDGGYYGWPFTAGNAPPIEGAIPPVYTFPTVVAPTGILRLNGANSVLKSGYLIGAFVGKTIFYVPDIDARPLPDPIPLLAPDRIVIDVAQTSAGDILFTTGGAIYRLEMPLAGDCDDDGRLTIADLAALRNALANGGVAATHSSASWGCDANKDGLINGDDLAALAQLLQLRVRAVRRR